MLVYKNDYIEITEKNGKVYLLTAQSGYPLKEFDGILRSFPRIKLTNFALLKNVLTKVGSSPIEVGQWLPQIEIEVSRDKMTASLFINETAEYIRSHKEKLASEVTKLLQDNRIIHGTLPLHTDKIIPAKAILIAQGTPPVKGADAQITYLEIPERKPVIREDGKADYYDMNFIHEIKEGSWLGEKIPPQPGIDGMTIHGEVIPAPPGRDASLKYDRKSAYEVEEEGKIILRSRIGGVLEHSQGQISVNHHLPVNGDVGIETGNIDFEGSISIRGSVQPGYSVIAKGDISIEGPEGVSGAKLIKSIEGDIYIRGGIFGLGETRVEAGGNIFVKHVNEANLLAGQSISIGFYAIGSNLKATSILVDERKGKIIGGKAVAKKQIVTSISGNRLERRTELIINSVNKEEAYAHIQDKATYLKGLHEETMKLEEQVNRLDNVQLNSQQLAALEQAKQNLQRQKDEAAYIDQEIKQMMNDLRNVGKEEIVVTKTAYPGTFIQVGRKASILSKETNGKFLLEFGELNV
ncbi:DUF342 domain-containing protein [Lysinibacillus odysseyi]|uniref:Flagellar Assembly Protein A N-terminal region domain-containing protein n=1 Tax=Lysinibacillus odysseyi 34hs-1 = NBRC 100172 TaxID=1220589 RepID=A0A0A3IA31_9BACI|nr:FapA family protein [Lysinibacillus odysseyi]KGR81631.1 hypothetical protein CD32_19970 [Lysinibacillus odysseyi 34hs-1 = NBRC 100172]